VTITYGSDVTGLDVGRVGRGMPRAPVPFCGCGGTPHGRGSFAERTVSGGRLSGRGKGVAKQAGVATGGPLFTICTKRGGVGTWWRRNPSGTVSVTWRSVPGGCSCSGRKREGWKESGMAGVPSQREGTGQDGGRKREGRGSLAMGGNGPGRKGESGKAGVPSQWEGTGQEEKEKAGWPGFPHSGKERARGEESGMSTRSVSGVGAGGWFGSWIGSGMRIRIRIGIGIGIGMSSAGSARYFYCLGCATVGLRAAGDSRLGRWGSSAQCGVRVLSAGRNTGSGADSVDAVTAVGSALIFCPGSEKEWNFFATGSIS
jgi:hypothetical protein